MENGTSGFRGFNIFQANDTVTFSRHGTKMIVRGRDNVSAESGSVEANLLYEILRELKKSRYQSKSGD